MANKPSKSEIQDFQKQADAWFKENTVSNPGFMLPLTFMEVSTDRQFDFLRDWQRKTYEAGYLGTSWPAEYGGGGMHADFQRVATSAMKKYDAPIMINAVGNGWVGPLILDKGSEEEKKKYIPGILSAEDIWCQGFSEPEHGSDLGNAQLRAERDGDEYILNGSKIWTSLGDRAKYMMLLARTDFDAPNKYAGLSYFFHPMENEGIETRRIKKLTGEYGFVQCFFTDARIPADSLFGEEGEGWKMAMRTLEYERGAKVNPVGGYYVKELDVMEIVELAKNAMRGGKPLLDDPVMRDKMTQFMIDIQALNLNNKRRRMPQLMQDRPMGLPLMNKLARTDLIQKLTEFSLEFQGTKAAYYVGDENAVDDGYWHRSYLNSFSATIGGGTSQIQRNIIGEHALGLPKTR